MQISTLREKFRSRIIAPSRLASSLTRSLDSAVFPFIQIRVKKVKVTLVQALRLCIGRTAHRGSRGITLPFLDHGTRWRWGVSVMYRPLFTPGKDPVPIVQEAGSPPGPVWTGAENLAPPGFDPRTVQPVASRYIDYATRTTLLWTHVHKTEPFLSSVTYFKPHQTFLHTLYLYTLN